MPLAPGVLSKEAEMIPPAAYREDISNLPKQIWYQECKSTFRNTLANLFIWCFASFQETSTHDHGVVTKQNQKSGKTMYSEGKRTYSFGHTDSLLPLLQQSRNFGDNRSYFLWRELRHGAYKALDRLCYLDILMKRVHKRFFMKACIICFWRRWVFIEAWDEWEERENSSSKRGKTWRLHSGNSGNALLLLAAGRCRSGGSGFWKSHFMYNLW